MVLLQIQCLDAMLPTDTHGPFLSKLRQSIDTVHTYIKTVDGHAKKAFDAVRSAVANFGFAKAKATYLQSAATYLQSAGDAIVDRTYVANFINSAVEDFNNFSKFFRFYAG
jgi:hypothetical protein